MKKLFTWHGIHSDGHMITGTEVAENPASVKTLLLQQKITPLKISVHAAKTTRKKLSTIHCFRFLLKLAKLLQTGLTMVNSLEIIEQSSSSTAEYHLAQFIKEKIRQGKTLSDALRHFSHYFSASTCAMVIAGERSGILATVLQQIAEQQLSLEQWKTRLLKSLRYPALVISTAIVLIYLLLAFAIPQMESLYADFNAPLPKITLMVIQIANFFRQYSLLLFFIVMGLVVIFRFSKKKMRMQKIWHSLLLKNKGYMQYQKLQWFFTLQVCSNAGLDLQSALQLASQSVANSVLQGPLSVITTGIQSGFTLSSAVQQSKLFDLETIALLTVAEKTNQLSEILREIYIQQRQALIEKIENSSKMLEPIIILVLAVVIGMIVIALYMPIFTMGKVM